jgi:hypothetical protein
LRTLTFLLKGSDGFATSLEQIPCRFARQRYQCTLRNTLVANLPKSVVIALSLCTTSFPPKSRATSCQLPSIIFSRDLHNNRFSMHKMAPIEEILEIQRRIKLTPAMDAGRGRHPIQAKTPTSADYVNRNSSVYQITSTLLAFEPGLFGVLHTPRQTLLILPTRVRQ